MSEKHLPYIGGNFDCIVFEGDGSTWVREQSGTRYAELFGTPERAAWTLAKACGECSDKFPCWECPLSPIIGSNVYEPEILEWLRGESE